MSKRQGKAAPWNEALNSPAIEKIMTGRAGLTKPAACKQGLVRTIFEESKLTSLRLRLKNYVIQHDTL